MRDRSRAWRHGWGRARLAVALVAAASVLAGACGLLEAPPPAPTPVPPETNVIANPGFEAGPDAWHSVEREGAEAAVDEGRARSGARSLLLALDALSEEGLSAAVQTIQTDVLPEYLSGWYRVERWEIEAESVYIQLVVRVAGAVTAAGVETMELRIIVAGAERDPVELPEGSAFVFLSRAAPRLDSWTYFGYPVRQAFASRLVQVPEQWESIELSLEVRYAGAAGASGEADGAVARERGAVVYIDDLYAGPYVDNPNRPD